MYEVLTVNDIDWLDKKNGELMRLIMENYFEVFVMADRNLIYQQNINRLNFIVAVLCGRNNKITTYQSLIPKLLILLSQNPVSKVLEVS